MNITDVKRITANIREIYPSVNPSLELVIEVMKLEAINNLNSTIQESSKQLRMILSDNKIENALEAIAATIETK